MNHSIAMNTQVRIWQARVLFFTLCSLVTVGFSACPADNPASFSVSATVSGLKGSGLLLKNNGTDDLSVTTDGVVTFATKLATNAAYVVTVAVQPNNPSQTCTPTNNAGTIGSANITNVSLTCASVVIGSAPIGPDGGTVSGVYGAQVIVPAGALATNTEIGISRDSSKAPLFALENTNSAGAAYELTPHGTTFALPVTVRIPFDATQVTDDSAPKLYKAETGGGFSEIPTTVDGDMLVAKITGFSWVIPAYAVNRPRNVYALTKGTSPATAGVSSFKINPSTGVLSLSSTATTGDSPISVVAHPSGRFLYVTNGGTVAANGVNPNSIAVYQLSTINGKITGPVSSMPTGAVPGSQSDGPIVPVIDPSGRFIYVLNHAYLNSVGGNISLYTINGATGALSQPTNLASGLGASPTAIAFNLSGTLAYVSYIAPYNIPVENTFFNHLEVYAVDSNTGVLIGPVGGVSVDTPWDVVVESNGKFVDVASLGSDQVTRFLIDGTTAALTYFGKITVQSKPASLAIDPLGRFLYVGKQTPFNNVNLLAYQFNPNSGALSPAGEALTKCDFGCTGPISIVAEPEGNFVYAINHEGRLSSFKVNPTSGVLTSSESVNGNLVPQSPRPFKFAATGPSPRWVNDCTFGCFIPTGSSGGSGGGGGGTPPNPTHFFLTVTRGAWGGWIKSTPAGIDYGDPNQSNNFSAEFAKGTSVQLCETPPSTPAQAYDVLWTGSASGTTKCVSVTMNSDKQVQLVLTPR